eukprot:13524357-Alexandrium_andersonii.AAC.1
MEPAEQQRGAAAGSGSPAAPPALPPGVGVAWECGAAAPAGRPATHPPQPAAAEGRGHGPGVPGAETHVECVRGPE